MTARDITSADTDDLAAIHALAFDAPWTARAIIDLLASGAFGLRLDDGFILCREGGGESEILTLAVAPAARRRGTGRLLVEAGASASAARGADVFFLEVAADNEAALALYASTGFKPAGLRRGYYARGEERMIDAIILSRTLNRG